ncbi:hypothetical protein ACJJTC_017485 [Scirpophaga incertulas]
MSSSDSDREVIDILTNSSETKEDNRRGRIYKERVNYLATLDSYEFQVRFRLDKESTEQLLLEIYPHIRVTGSMDYLATNGCLEMCISSEALPLLNPQAQGQILYNVAHIRTRNCIERCFGVWKRRFPVVGLTLRLSLLRAHTVIIATAVLHNICRTKNLADVPAEIEIPDAEFVPAAINADEINIVTERDKLIEEYFNK